MESGFLNKKKSSSSSGLGSKISNIDGKLLVNKDKPLKSILKCAGLEGKTGSFPLPNEFGSNSRARCGPNGANSQSTLLGEVAHTRESFHGSFVVNNSGVPVVDSSNSVLDNVMVHEFVTTKATNDSSLQHDGVSFVDSDLVTPGVTMINKPKVQESSSTNESSTSGAKVVIPISVVEEMCHKFSNSLYGYFIGQRPAFTFVEDYVYHAWVKVGFQKVILRGNFLFFQF